MRYALCGFPNEVKKPVRFFLEQYKNDSWVKTGKERKSEVPVYYELSGRYEAMLSLDDLKPGLYRIGVPEQRGVPNTVISHDFLIGESEAGLYTDIRDLSLSAWYYWMAGPEGMFSRAHTQDQKAVVMELNGDLLVPAGKTINVCGGFYDAGDYGEYVVNGAYSMGFILQSMETAPSAFDFSATVNDKTLTPIDIVMHELEWILSMQHPSGGFHHKLATANWPGEILPHQDRKPRYVLPVSTNATANAGAVLAKAARLFRDVYPDFAERALAAAEKAWDYLSTNFEESPQASYKADLNGDGKADGTYSFGGQYGDDNVEDELFWMAVELHAATGNEEYIKAVKNAFFSMRGMFSEGFNVPHSWQNVSSLALFSLYTSSHDKVIKTTLLEKSFIPWAKTLVKHQKGQLYTYIIAGKEGGLDWGSNSVVLTTAWELLAIASIVDEPVDAASFKDAAQKAFHYILGLNPVGYSYITGVGDRYPEEPHMRYALAAYEVPPGYLVGGANSTNPGGDPALIAMEDLPPLLRYSDTGRGAGWAINEIAINWNASLLGFTALFVAD